MQLHIVNRDFRGYLEGDILAVLPDVVPFGPLEVFSQWAANDPAGLPDVYKTPSEGGTFEERTRANFPNKWSSVVRYPSFRCDDNLAEPWLMDGVEDHEGKRLWYVDLSNQGGVPPGQRKSILLAGGEGTLGANRLDAIKNRQDGTGLSAAWESDTTMCDTHHRHPDTMTVDRKGPPVQTSGGGRNRSRLAPRRRTWP